MRQYYVGDLLLIRTANLAQRRGISDLKVGEQGLHVVPPVYRGLTDDEQTNGFIAERFNSPRTSHVTMLSVCDRHRVLHIRHEWRGADPKKRPPVDFIEAYSNVVISISPQFIADAKKNLVFAAQEILRTS
jgi:hypothetical protein